MSSCLMFGKCNRGWSDAYVGARNAEKKRRGGLDKGHQDRLDSETDLLEELKK